MTGTLELDRREMFSVFQAENIRFFRYGHDRPTSNNVAFAALLESGRSAFSHARLFGHVPQGFLVVMARVEIDYRRELHWPARVDIGTRIVAVGRSSYTMGSGHFSSLDTCLRHRPNHAGHDRSANQKVHPPVRYYARGVILRVKDFWFFFE